MVAISNRSFMKGMGVATWTIEGTNKEGWCMGTCMTPGDPKDRRAFQSCELTSLYGIFSTLKKHIAEKWAEEGLEITVACNGKSAVDHLNLKNL